MGKSCFIIIIFKTVRESQESSTLTTNKKIQNKKICGNCFHSKYYPKFDLILHHRHCNVSYTSGNTHLHTQHTYNTWHLHMFYRQIEYQHEMDEVGKSKNFKCYSQTFWVSFLLNASGQFPSNETMYF